MSVSNVKFNISVNLMATLTQGLLGIALIPFATFILNPDDYGVYGIATVLVVFIASVCDYGASYLIYGHYPNLNKSDRASMESTFCFASAMLGMFAIVVVLLIWQILEQFIPLLAQLTSIELFLLCIGIPLRALSSTMSPFLIVRNSTRSLAASLFLQSVANFLVVLVCLYLLDMGRPALFWGQFIGLAVWLIFPVKLVKPSVGGLNYSWFSYVRSIGLLSIAGSVIENSRTAIENILVARYWGDIVLGLYTNARSYQSILYQGANAVATVVFPIALAEASNFQSRFERIRPIWSLIYGILTCIGIGAVFFGSDLTGFMTHGKFSQAGVWLPWLVLYVLVQNAGKPATAVLFATNNSRLYMLIRIFIIVAAIALLVYFVPLDGPEGVITIAILDMVATRILLGFAAKRIRSIPFQDQWVILGSLLIVISWLLNDQLDLDFSQRLCTVAGISITIILGVMVSEYSLRSKLYRILRKLL